MSSPRSDDARSWPTSRGSSANFHGREYSGPIGPETRFFADLGLASIDAVVLGETLQRTTAAAPVRRPDGRARPPRPTAT